MRSVGAGGHQHPAKAVAADDDLKAEKHAHQAVAGGKKVVSSSSDERSSIAAFSDKDAALLGGSIGLSADQSAARLLAAVRQEAEASDIAQAAAKNMMRSTEATAEEVMRKAQANIDTLMERAHSAIADSQTGAKEAMEAAADVWDHESGKAQEQAEAARAKLKGSNEREAMIDAALSTEGTVGTATRVAGLIEESVRTMTRKVARFANTTKDEAGEAMERVQQLTAEAKGKVDSIAKQLTSQGARAVTGIKAETSGSLIGKQTSETASRLKADAKSWAERNGNATERLLHTGQESLGKMAKLLEAAKAKGQALSGSFSAAGERAAHLLQASTINWRRRGEEALTSVSTSALTSEEEPPPVFSPALRPAPSPPAAAAASGPPPASASAPAPASKALAGASPGDAPAVIRQRAGK